MVHGFTPRDPSRLSHSKVLYAPGFVCACTPSPLTLRACLPCFISHIHYYLTMTSKPFALTNEMKFKILDAMDENSKKVNGLKRKLVSIKPCTLSALVKALESIETRAYSG